MTTETKPQPVTDAEIEELERLLGAISPAPWEHCRITQETPGEQAAYVAECISRGKGHFHIVMATKPDGLSYDVAHTGNGPDSAVNGHFIEVVRSALPRLLSSLRASRAAERDLRKLAERLLEACDRAEAGKHSPWCNEVHEGSACEGVYLMDGFLSEARALLSPSRGTETDR